MQKAVQRGMIVLQRVTVAREAAMVSVTIERKDFLFLIPLMWDQSVEFAWKWNDCRGNTLVHLLLFRIQSETRASKNYDCGVTPTLEVHHRSQHIVPSVRSS